MGDKGEEIQQDRAASPFGRVPLSEDKKAFYAAFNQEIPLLCRTLPEPIRAEALLFYMSYAGISLGEELDFFRHYPMPSWSIVYWLTRDGGGVAPEVERNAVTAHAMALSLHSLDDHLLDGQIPLTSLALLLRSQSWMRMNQALEHLACGVQGGDEVIGRCLADYHATLANPGEPDSLDAYCRRFRKEMATGTIVPALLAMRRKEDPPVIEALEAGSASFGLVWRLLDDIQDLQSDMKNHVHSAVYILLPETMKASWDTCAQGEDEGSEEDRRRILECVEETGILGELFGRIEHELESAVSLAERFAPPGFVQEIRHLLRPPGKPGDP